MRRVCISIRRRRTRRGTSVREQEEKRDYTTAAGIKKNKVIRSEFLARQHFRGRDEFSWTSGGNPLMAIHKEITFPSSPSFATIQLTNK